MAANCNVAKLKYGCNKSLQLYLVITRILNTYQGSECVNGSS